MYMNYNTKLVNKVDAFAVVDMGMKGQYPTLEYPCDNKKIAVISIHIRMPNGEILTSTHTAILSKTDLPIESRKTHIFSVINKALLSIGTFCDHVCQAVFDDKKVIILNKGNGKIMMKGRQNALSNLYMLNLTQGNNLMKGLQTPDKSFAVSVYECK